MGELKKLQVDFIRCSSLGDLSGSEGLGGTAKLVLLPNESHGYRARESVLHVLAESFDWFDKYVKNPAEDAKTK